MPITSSEGDYFDMVSGDSGFPVTRPKYKVLIEGDSWVSHPLLSHLAIQFDNLGKDEFAILNVAIPGDTAKRMFSKNSKQLRKMGQLLHDSRFGYRFDMIFVSAAGNDVVGEEIISFVDKHLTDGRMGVGLINTEFDGIIKQISRNYKNLIELRDNSQINKGLDNFSFYTCMLRLCYARKKQVFQAFTPFRSQIQNDCTLFCARFTGLENCGVE